MGLIKVLCDFLHPIYVGGGGGGGLIDPKNAVSMGRYPVQVN